MFRLAGTGTDAHAQNNALVASALTAGQSTRLSCASTSVFDTTGAEKGTVTTDRRTRLKASPDASTFVLDGACRRAHRTPRAPVHLAVVVSGFSRTFRRSVRL